jgi:hypothetical protein
VNRDHPGKINLASADNRNVYQEIDGALPGGEFGTAAYFNGSIYYGPVDGTLRRYNFSNARLNGTPASESSISYGYPGTTPSISSWGNLNGIVWAYENAATEGNPAVLHAYDALDLRKELFNSTENAVRDQFGRSNKFIAPMISNGKVYAGTQDSVGAFGLMHPMAATDVSRSLLIQRGPLEYNSGNGHYTQTVTLRNTGPTPIPMPVSLVLDNLTETASLTNAPGGTAITAPSGSPYISPRLTGNLLPGQNVSVGLNLVNSVKGPISYTARVLAGTNSR